jgi:methionyl-tRNA formyltransferase
MGLNCNNRWVVLYSRTGLEIVELSKRLKIKPDLILTTNKNVTKDILNLSVPIFYITNSIEDFNKYLRDDDLITLHGYLKIIPFQITNKHNIYNGHPGLIIKYPELKGFNPQAKAHKLKHKEIGTVIYKVTPIVDGGEVIYSNSIILDKNRDYNLDYYYKVLSKLSLNAWIKALGELNTDV